MDPKFRKFKQQESKSHEKLLKVILQIYKPILRRRAKPSEKTLESEQETSYSEEIEEIPNKPKDYSSCATKVDDMTLEKQRKEQLALKILGNNCCPGLVSQFVNGEISLSQLKQAYYAQVKKIEYVCYDNLKSSFEHSEPSHLDLKRIRECHKNYEKACPMKAPRPKSASWNQNTKVERPQSYSITNSIYNGQENSKTRSSCSEINKQKWNQSVKADPSLITDSYRMINVTNDRKDRRHSNIHHGGRLSAKAMHDIIVETVHPEKRTQGTSAKEISYQVRSAVKKAAERVKSYQNKPKSMSFSMIKFSHSRAPSAGAEVRDLIYVA